MTRKIVILEAQWAETAHSWEGQSPTALDFGRVFRRFCDVPDHHSATPFLPIGTLGTRTLDEKTVNKNRGAQPEKSAKNVLEMWCF